MLKEDADNHNVAQINAVTVAANATLYRQKILIMNMTIFNQ